MQPNIRGSTGYGVLWRDANIKDWGGGDLEDVAAGAEYLKTLPFVDSQRIGIFGGSFGGFMSFLAVVKKPDLFKVGVPWIGITDLHTLFEEDMEHFKYYFRQQMGDPEKDYDLWRDRSAVTHADKLRAKLLILHGANDPRCPRVAGAHLPGQNRCEWQTRGSQSRRRLRVPRVRRRGARAVGGHSGNDSHVQAAGGLFGAAALGG